MNLRRWNREHTKGLIVGILSPLIFVPLVMLVLAWAQNFPFSRLWFMFTNDMAVKSKVLSLAIISNLIWFYWSLNKERFDFTTGVILGSIAFLPFILYVNFIA